MSSKYRVRIVAEYDLMAVTDSAAELLAMAKLQGTLDYMHDNEITEMKVGSAAGAFAVSVLAEYKD